MSSLLIPEAPLQVLPTLACLIGLPEAIVLQQVHYLSLRPSNHDGWVANTLDDWCQVFTFLSRRAIERAFSSLRQQRLLMSEPVPGGGRRTRVRVDHDVLDDLADLSVRHAEAIRQFGGTNPPIWRDQSAKLAGPIRQSGGTRLCKGTEELKAEELQNDASHRCASRSLSVEISEVFEAWKTATGSADGVLDDKRRRLIRRAVKSHGVAACIDAVRGWRHSAYHRGANDDGVPLNSIGLLLRDADQIERFSGLERHRGDSAKLPADAGPGGNVAGCPGPDPGPALTAAWSPIAHELAELVPQNLHSIWLAPLHPHAVADGTLIVGLPPEIATFVGERFRGALDRAARGVPVTLVECAEPWTRAAA